MRPITHGDVVAAARAVRHLPAGLRRAEITRYLVRAHAADLFRKRTGRAHAFWGNGSLAGSVMAGGMPAPEPFFSDVPYLEALAAVIEALLDWRQRGS